MDSELIKFVATLLKDSGLLPVVLFSLLLKVYVINGNINKHFAALRRERRLLRQAIAGIEKLVSMRECEDRKEGSKAYVDTVSVDSNKGQ